MTTSPRPREAWVKLRHPVLRGDGKDAAYLTCHPEFDPGCAFFVAIFFHGFEKPLELQVAKHALADQVAGAKRNCLLVCPRSSLNDGSGDNPGLFAQDAQLNGFLEELPEHICALAPAAEPSAVKASAAAAPLVVATFSGGHSLASRMLLHERSRRRVECCALFDSLYGSDQYFKNPMTVLRTAALVAVHRDDYDSNPGTYEYNKHKDLQVRLGDSEFASSLDKVERLGAGVAVLESVSNTGHWDIVSKGSPLAKILSKFHSSDGEAYSLRRAEQPSV